MIESWARIERLFQQVVELPDAECDAILARECAGAPDLRRLIESLLVADRSAGSFLDPLDPPTVADVAVRAPESLAGRSMGRYRILRRLGRGGMATVYLAARDRDFRKQVAIKVFGHDRRRGDLLRRFEHERQILAGLEHPYIARLIDGGSTPEGLPFLVMELVDGEPIDLYCDCRRLSIDQRIDLFLRLCEAVSYAHRRLVVHRDLKPSNVLVTRDGVPKLLDFGIAKLLEDDGDSLETVAGHRLMTPAYASPEQVLGQPITTGSDVYSLGVLLHVLLCGTLPYPGSHRRRDVERAIVEDDPVAPSVALAAALEDGSAKAAAERRREELPRLRRRLRGDLDNMVLEALRKDPAERYGSVAELHADLRRYRRGQPVRARPATFAYLARKFAGRHRLAVATMAATLVLVLGFVIFGSLLARQVTIERDEARLERDKARQSAELLQEILALSDPDQAKGETISTRKILDRGAQRLDEELQEDQPEIFATLASSIAAGYLKKGLDDRAEPLLERAHEIARAELGVDHPAFAEVLHLQGGLWAYRGDLERAEALLRRALTIRRRQGGKPLAATLDELGAVLSMQGKFDQSESILKAALELERQLFGDDATVVAGSLNNLGVLYDSRGGPAAAKVYYREALEILQRIDPDHSNLIALYFNLGVIELERGELTAAEASYRQAHRIASRVLGEDHPKTLIALGGLGSALAEQGATEDAERLLETALRGQRRRRGDDHPRVAEVMRRQGVMLLGIGEPTAARRRLEAALEIYRDRLGERHPVTGRILLLIGHARLGEGEARAAERFFRDALAIRRDAFGDEHYRVAETRVALGSSLLAQGHAEQAEPLLRHGLASLRRVLPEGAPLVVEAQGELDACLATLGRIEASSNREQRNA
ncbi:MAG: serine/threonine protein kinase [bacterium]|nr:serine/threonine protein kinase [bacterium]